jgi:hypothetical protein
MRSASHSRHDVVIVGARAAGAAAAMLLARLGHDADSQWAGMELFVAERSFAGVFPTHGGQACIWVCTPSAGAKAARRRAGSREEAFGELLERSAPQLAGRLRHARRTSPSPARGAGATGSPPWAPSSRCTRAVIAGHERPDRSDDPQSIEQAGQYIRDFDRIARTTSTRAGCRTRSWPATQAASAPAPCGRQRVH